MPEQPDYEVKPSVALALLGALGLVAAVAMLADARWALLVASVVLIYGAFVAASHGR